jgi:hypothetical protein
MVVWSLFDSRAIVAYTEPQGNPRSKIILENYQQWRERLRVWAGRYRSINQAAEDMARRVRLHGEEVSPWTVRKHIKGKYSEIGLRLYNAINQVIDNAD